ncbi:MAG: T9SS type A sorting domain-containing protein [Candidatus Krumholzibacteria bacterium]|nr:T9SS type A sorting domain-containing protein [Candidatus Krumholzibacteria bacterium]MDH5271229.1 T9SS type A sorting domain-containing protein [Candidatus Krumholzibacteria bacterium]
MIRFRCLILPVLFLSVSLALVLAAAARSPLPASKGGVGPNRILILDGSPVHDAGNLWVHASNFGMIGSWPGANLPFSFAPSAQWPGGSNVEYLYTAGLWVGALVNGVPAVSTAAYEFEFRPTADPRDIVYYSVFGALGGKRIPSMMADDDGDGLIDEDRLDGFDNDGDGLIDEDYAGISDQMLSRVFRDDTPEATQVYPQHNPMHLSVREESYQFSNPDYDDFVGFTFWITNDGNVTASDAYIALFADGDVGNRTTPNYWEDDGVAFRNDISVDLGPHGTQAYDFMYMFDDDGDGGEASGYCGFVILDHPVDPTGSTAPTQVGAVTFRNFHPGASFENGGDPTNDFERYEVLSSQSIDRNPVVPFDARGVVAAGPFNIAPGQTVSFTCALVATPRGDFTNVQRAATAYHGLWFDLDGDPNTGIGGKEHQEHWYLPNDNPVPVAITSFEPRVADGAVHLEWETWSDEGLAGFEILRATGSGDLRALGDGMLPGNQHDYVDRSVEPGTRYDYQLVAHGAEGWTTVSARVSATVPRAGLALRQNVPNPFSTETMVSFTLPERGDVKLAVYDVAGRRVATLFSGEQGAGDHSVEWNGVGDNGERVGAGVYFVRIEAGKQTVTRKLLVMR